MSERVVTGRRRTRQPNGSPRTRRVVVKLSDQEYERVTARARQVGVSVPQLYELSVWGESSQVAAELSDVRAELRLLWRGLSGALTNVNQMAKYANTEQHVHPDNDVVRAELRQRIGQLEDVLERLPKIGRR